MGIALGVIVVFSLDNQFSVDNLRVAGYKQNNDGYTGIQLLLQAYTNSCGNGILLETDRKSVV